MVCDEVEAVAEVEPVTIKPVEKKEEEQEKEATTSIITTTELDSSLAGSTSSAEPSPPSSSAAAAADPLASSAVLMAAAEASPSSIPILAIVDEVIKESTSLSSHLLEAAGDDAAKAPPISIEDIIEAGDDAKGPISVENVMAASSSPSSPSSFAFSSEVKEEGDDDKKAKVMSCRTKARVTFKAMGRPFRKGAKKVVDAAIFIHKKVRSAASYVQSKVRRGASHVGAKLVTAKAIAGQRVSTTRIAVASSIRSVGNTLVAGVIRPVITMGNFMLSPIVFGTNFVRKKLTAAGRLIHLLMERVTSTVRSLAYDMTIFFIYLPYLALWDAACGLCWLITGAGQALGRALAYPFLAVARLCRSSCKCRCRCRPCGASAALKELAEGTAGDDSVVAA